MQTLGSACIVQVFFHDRVGVAKELLKQMDTQHHLRGKGGMPVFPAGASGAFNASSSFQGIPNFISPRDSRLRVRYSQLGS